MNDLSDERLDELAKWSNGYGMPETSQALRELQRRRAEQAAGREHVERVVREMARERPSGSACKFCERTDCDTDCYFADMHNGTARRTAAEWRAEGARRVADRLSVPVLSAGDVDVLLHMRKSIQYDGDFSRLLDRLIAGAKPDAEPVDWSSRLRGCADQLSKLAETYIIEHGQVLLRSSIKAKP